jgi:hypothetical protein
MVAALVLCTLMVSVIGLTLKQKIRYFEREDI